MKRLLTFISCVVLLLLLCSSVVASPDKKQKRSKEDTGTTITLVTSGTGDTKEEATKNALRSALEQTYGAFVSSNSQVVNDELVKDEIVSISTGNIVSYEELSFIDSNPKQVSVSAVVSITRLQNYAQNKGMSAELAGNTFAMNLKMEELNKKNQDVALKHMLEQTRLMSQNLFDYELTVGNPEKTPKGVQVPLTIRIKANNNTVSYYDYFHKTLTSLAVQKKTGRDVHLYGEHGIEIDGMKQFDGNAIVYVLRGDARDPEPHNTLYELEETLDNAILSCEIVDNIGNTSGFSTTGHGKSYSERILQSHRSTFYTTNKLYFEYYGGSGRSSQLCPFRNGYTDIFPYWYNSGFKNYHWMNAVRPKVGEKLFETKLFLMYTVDEISKVSKIEVRPKQAGYNSIEEKSTAEVNMIKSFYDDWDKANEYVDLYNKKTTFDEDARTYLVNAYNLLKKIQSNPQSVNVINPNSVNDLIEAIKDVIKKKGIEL